MNDNTNKIILDLCGGTGSWSKPYKDAGYDVRIITWPNDVREWYKDGELRTLVSENKIYGVLAAPPCTMFSFARTKAKKPRDLRAAMSIVKACLDIIYECQYETRGKKSNLQFWALENPYGLLRHFLGNPVFIFNPYDFGDRYQKKTCLWGFFNIPKKSPVTLTEEERYKFSTHTQQLPNLPEGYTEFGDLDRRAARRAITPQGFAKAFMEANP